MFYFPSISLTLLTILKAKKLRPRKEVSALPKDLIHTLGILVKAWHISKATSYGLTVRNRMAYTLLHSTDVLDRALNSTIVQ